MLLLSRRKQFFFEKKNQKTFVSADADSTGKSFLLLFFKKEGLPFLGLIVPVFLLIAWQAAGTRIPQDLLPAPATVLRALVQMARSGELAGNLIASLRRLALGFCLGAGVGTVLGAVTGGSVAARRLLDPTVQALRSVPSIAWVPPFILWFGIFEGSKVYLIALGAFFPVYLNLMAGIANVDRKMVEVGQVLTLTPLQRVVHILLPASLPSYVIGLRTGLGLAWMFVAAAELMGASDGLGFLLMDAEQTGRPERVLGAILLFAVCGKATDWGVAALGARLNVAGHRGAR
jgi:sulfonate transport system permease protein